MRNDAALCVRAIFGLSKYTVVAVRDSTVTAFAAVGIALVYAWGVYMRWGVVEQR